MNQYRNKIYAYIFGKTTLYNVYIRTRKIISNGTIRLQLYRLLKILCQVIDKNIELSYSLN